MAVYSLGERKVSFHGDEWFIAENAAVIGTVQPLARQIHRR